MEVDEECFDFEFISPAQPSLCRWALGTKEKSPHVPVEKKKEKILPNILSHVGDTPLVRLNHIPREYGLDCEFLVKCEFFNPGGSVKDRIAIRMIEEAEREGKIKPGWTLIEPTSGNTGIGLALAAAVKGYHCIIVMPQKMSAEKENVIRALGAQVIRTPTAAAYNAPNSNFAVAQRLAQKIPNSYVLDQFRNVGNPLAHYDATAEEILTVCDGKLDMIVMGAGTGGTVTGIGRKIREKAPNCVVVTVDPEGSTLAPDSNGEPGFYEVEGIGYDFIPTVLDRSVIDKWIKTNDRESFLMARQLIMKEGLLCGGSSGSAVVGAIKAAKELGLKKGHRIVAILADGVRNYMTKFLNDQWMKQREFPLPNGKGESSSFHGQERDPWYFDIAIRNITQGMDLVTVDENTKVSDAISLMKQRGYDQLPVVKQGAPTCLLGMVSVYELMAKIAAGSVKGNTSVSQALNQAFERLPQDATIGSLSHALKNTQFVVVVESLLGEESSRIVGILTHIDVLNYLIEMEASEQ